MDQQDKPRERGRPPLNPEDRLIQRSIRLTAAQWAKVDEHGIDWLRRLIQRAKPQKKQGPPGGQ